MESQFLPCSQEFPRYLLSIVRTETTQLSLTVMSSLSTFLLKLSTDIETLSENFNECKISFQHFSATFHDRSEIPSSSYSLISILLHYCHRVSSVLTDSIVTLHSWENYKLKVKIMIFLH